MAAIPIRIEKFKSKRKGEYGQVEYLVTLKDKSEVKLVK